MLSDQVLRGGLGGHDIPIGHALAGAVVAQGVGQALHEVGMVRMGQLRVLDHGPSVAAAPDKNKTGTDAQDSLPRWAARRSSFRSYFT